MSETSLVDRVFATASSSRSQVSLRGIVGRQTTDVRPSPSRRVLEKTREAEELPSVHEHTRIERLRERVSDRAL